MSPQTLSTASPRATDTASPSTARCLRARHLRNTAQATSTPALQATGMPWLWALSTRSRFKPKLLLHCRFGFVACDLFESKLFRDTTCAPVFELCFLTYTLDLRLVFLYPCIVHNSRMDTLNTILRQHIHLLIPNPYKTIQRMFKHSEHYWTQRPASLSI